MASAGRVLADTWYATYLGPRCVTLSEQIETSFPAWLVQLAGRSSIVRGLLTFALAGAYDRLILGAHRPGAWTTIVLEALLRRRPRVVLLEFMHGAPVGWRRLVYPIWFALVRRPALRKVVLLAHTLTQFEQEQYAALYGVPAKRFACVPWPMRFETDTLPPFAHAEQPTVVCSGRAACDWDTLFRAARSANWRLTVVCSARDLPRVQKLSVDSGVRVLSEISAEEHQALVASAAVYVLCLRETHASAGHVRLMQAIRAGTPVVATRVRALDGYAVPGTTALLVEPADPAGLRACVDALLANSRRRECLRERAFAYAAGRTFEQYVHQIQAEVWLDDHGPTET